MFEKISDGLRTIGDYLFGKNIGHIDLYAGQIARRNGNNFAV